jgi:peroxin-1
MTSRHPIVIIATSQQQQSIHPSLVTNHIFNQLYHLNPPGRDERKQVRLSPDNPFDEKVSPMD